MQGEAATGSDLYYYSDFQRSAFPAKEDAAWTKNIRFYGIPVQAKTAQNIYIDSAYLDAPVLQTGTPNKLLVRTKLDGEQPKEAPVLQLTVNGQVKSASAVNFNNKNESIDTLSFSVNDANWQKIVLTVNDASVRFDDTFRITARSAPNLSVLVMNESQQNPYIQAAFRAYNGFQLTQTGINTNTTDWKQYNLIILNGITHLDAAMGKAIATTLQQGQTVCLFPGKTANIAVLNDGLKEIGDIRITGIDTATQAATTLQQGNTLVKDMFEAIPENVQLPVANWHYVLESGLSSNQQSVLSFRNGTPMFASYTPSRSPLYIASTSADMESGNFPGSYFFVPFLYQMAMQSGGGSIYALTLGKTQAAFIPFDNVSERNMVHVYGGGIDAIPPQRPAGTGIDVFVGNAVQQAGFYSLSAAGSDTAMVALNNDRKESVLNTWEVSALKNQWNSDAVHWIDIDNIGREASGSALGSFPLWKVCAILALIMLAAETYLLAQGFRKQSAATQ